ncbi:hypothetical protein [Microvirga terricola]|uniref:Thymidylate kinase n=1 Tax=Microvirga terricola TaxID=2719797 RepID=A0ABX0VE23_9HYPH|nr:hypothetical protein [Microvirga terricola]NIX78089.1 hypothetical protein [Microvirga terricola]
MSDVEAQTQTSYSTLPTPPKGLPIVQNLFTRLHKADLAYCHWKSNEHLGAAVEGLTDLDVLVDQRRASDLQRILAESGFRRFAAPPLRAYPAVEDYLGFDDGTGHLVHLHLHYQLTLGQRHLKGYRVPWEHQVLARRILDPQYGIYVADPATELVLLLVRAALKQRIRDRLRLRSKRRLKGAVADFHREFAWLRERVDDNAVCETAHGFLGSIADEPLRRLLDDQAISNRLTDFSAAVRPALRRYRTYGPLAAPLRAWLRELQWAADAVNRRYLHRPVPLRRISPRGGTVIVLLGSDGSGKSSLAKTLVSWLGVKLDVMPIYFGSGDGPSSFYRLPLRLAHRLLSPVIGNGKKSRSVDDNGLDHQRLWMRVRSSLRAAALIPWALTLSLEKRGKLRRMTRARNRGMIVVCDRFAQADIPGFNDGPLLAHWRRSRWRICRALAVWEAKPYADAKLDPPDLVIKLNVTPEVALGRRPEMSLEEIRRRVQAVQSFRFQEPARVVEIGTDVPLDEVALAAKRLVWDEI